MSRKNIYDSLLLIVFLTTFLLGCGLEDEKDKITDTGSRGVKYEITGTASRVDVTYVNNNGGTSQEANVLVPWTYNFTGYKDDFVYISAQNQGKSGEVIAAIYKDGKIFKSSISRGAYVIATASGSL